MARRRRWPLALLLPGLVLVGGSFWWRSTMVDRLVTLPDDLDVTANYEGTVTLYVDKTTNMPLAAPEVHELTITRTVKANPELTTKDKIVILESIKLFSPGLFDSVQEHQYVMDRKTAVNIDDPLAWAYTPDNPVSRAGSYRLAFPFHMQTDQTYSVYKEELDSTYTPTIAGEFDTEGLATVRFDAKKGWAPADAAYLADVEKSVKLPD
ncbi:MAG TPA: porin PorA family protein, partial [Acidimicrobiales bacterium]